MIDKYVIEPDFRLTRKDWKQLGREVPTTRIRKRPKAPGWMAWQQVTLHPDHVWLEVCPAKVLGRWNVYGSNNLIEVVSETAPKVLQTMGVEMNAARLESLRQGQFTVRAVDITEQYRLRVGMNSTDFIRKFIREMVLIYPLMKHEKGEGIRINPGSKTLSYYIYDKLVEFEDRGTKAYDLAIERAHDTATAGLGMKEVGLMLERDEQRALAALGPRLELKFGEEFFAGHPLSRGGKWKPDTAQMLYRDGLAKLNLPRRIERDELRDDGYACLAQPFLGTFLLWLHDEQRALAEYSDSKMKAHRKAIERKLGVDIRAHAASAVIRGLDAVRPRTVFRWGNRVRHPA